jgi:multimeric flavodoxin WrbA
MKHVFAVNGSPRLEKGNTNLLLSAFLDGMQSAGAVVDKVYSSQLAMKSCIGDFYCWNVVPGKCIHKDDMDMLYPRIKKAEILVLATPVYIPLPGAFQIFLNRLYPLIGSFIHTRKGRTRTRFRSNVNIRQIILLATCGWWEIDNFITVERVIREFTEDVSVEYGGSVLRPHADFMRKKGKVTVQGNEVLQAAGLAGNEMIKSGRISPKILEKIAQPLISEEELRISLNQQYKDLHTKRLK